MSYIAKYFKVCYEDAETCALFCSVWHSSLNILAVRCSDYGSGVNSASDRNEYQVYFLGVKAAGA
jgi:hypothetical protein